MSNIPDYSYHVIANQQKLKSMQKALLLNDLEKALEEGTQALVELRMALTAIRSMRDNPRFRS